MKLIHWLSRSLSVAMLPPWRKWSLSHPSSLLNANPRSASTSSSLIWLEPLSILRVIRPWDSIVSLIEVRCASVVVVSLPQVSSSWIWLVVYVMTTSLTSLLSQCA